MIDCILIERIDDRMGIAPALSVPRFSELPSGIDRDDRRGRQDRQDANRKKYLDQSEPASLVNVC
jgi:hypothetical protein